MNKSQIQFNSKKFGNIKVWKTEEDIFTKVKYTNSKKQTFLLRIPTFVFSLNDVKNKTKFNHEKLDEVIVRNKDHNIIIEYSDNAGLRMAEIPESLYFDVKKNL